MELNVPIKEAVRDWTYLEHGLSSTDTSYFGICSKENIVLNNFKRGYKNGALLDSMKFSTKQKWAVDVDVLIDDSPEKLEDFDKQSVNGGRAICMKQNLESRMLIPKYKSIDRLSDLITKL